MAVSVTEVGLGVLAGSLSTLNPCVFPLLPLVLGGALQENRLAPVALGLGMATTFAALGMFIGTLGAGLGLDTDTFRTLGGALLILLAGVLLVPALNERFTLLMTPLSSGAQTVSSKLSGATLRAGRRAGPGVEPLLGPLADFRAHARGQ